MNVLHFAVTYEPTHDIMALIALRKLNLQTRMRSNPLELHVWFLVRPFVYFYTSCVRTAKALARLRGCAVSLEPSLFGCAVSPEPSLFAYAISTIISWAGSNGHFLSSFGYDLIDGWVSGFTSSFNSISVISGRWNGKHERLCAMKRRLGWGRFSPPAGFEPVTPWYEIESAISDFQVQTLCEILPPLQLAPVITSPIVIRSDSVSTQSWSFERSLYVCMERPMIESATSRTQIPHPKRTLYRYWDIWTFVPEHLTRKYLKLWLLLITGNNSYPLLL